MDPKIIEPHQCSLERSHAISIELLKSLISTKIEPYLDKHRCLGLLHTKICKRKIMKIFLENIRPFTEYVIQTIKSLKCEQSLS